MPENKQTGRAAEAARDAADETARTARVATDEALKTGQQAASAVADATRRGAETGREATRLGADALNDAVRRTTDGFLQVFGVAGSGSDEATRTASETLQAVSQAGAILAHGTQEAWHAWFGLARDRLSRNVEALNRLAVCRTVRDVVALQSDLVRDNLRQAIDTGRRVAELSLRTAEEAGRTIQAQANSNVDRLRRAA